MKRPPLPQVLFAIGLFFAGFLARGLFSTETEPASAEPGSEQSRLTEELAALQRENAALENQLARKAESEAARLAANTAPPSSEGSRFPIQRSGSGATISLASAESPFSSERFQTMMRAQVDRQLDIYSARLNLSEAQRDKLSEMMMLRFMQMSSPFQPGGDERDSPDAPRIGQSDIDDLASEILSQSQLDEYNEMRNQEIASRSEMMATAQLSQIAPQLGLSEEQKNQAYGIYYQQSMDLGAGLSDPEAYQASRQDANERILAILDEKQKAIFETIQQGNSGMANFTVIAE